MHPASGSVNRPLLGLALAATLVACGEPEEVTIAVAATSGFLDAARVAVEDELEKGPIPNLDTVLVLETSNRSRPAMEAARNLADSARPAAVVGHANSVASLATSQVYNQNEIVQIAPTSTTPLYSEAGPYSFRMVPPDHAQGRALAGVLADSLLAEDTGGAPAVASGAGGAEGSAATADDGGVEPVRIALLYVSDDYGRGLRSAFLEHLDSNRFDVVVDLPHTESDVDETDWDHQVQALESAPVEALVWLGRVPTLDGLLARVREAQGPIPVFGGDAVSRAARVGDLEADWSGVRYLDFVDMNATPERRAFQERTDFSAGGADALSYDAMRVLLSAVRAGARSGPEIRDYLESLGRDRPAYSGLTGPIQFDEHGDMARDFVLKAVEPPGTP